MQKYFKAVPKPPGEKPRSAAVKVHKPTAEEQYYIDNPVAMPSAIGGVQGTGGQARSGLAIVETRHS